MKFKRPHNLFMIFASTVLALSLFASPSFHNSNFHLEQTAHAKKKKKHKVKYLSLSVGVEHDEPMPKYKSSRAPKLGGTYKKFTKVYSDRKNRKKLRFDPKKEGVFTVIVKEPGNEKVIYEYRVDIKKTDVHKVAREVKNLLKEVEGITIKLANNKVYIDGQVILAQDIGRIHNVATQYGDLVVSLVTISPVAQVKLAQFIERAIGNPEIHVRAVNESFILEGVANSTDEKKNAERIAQAYIPDLVIDEYVAKKKVKKANRVKIINLITVKSAPEKEPSKIIQVVIHYVELKKDYAKSFRFQWTPEIGDGTNVSFTDKGAGGVITSITGTISNLLPKLNWAKSHGHARILQSSSIIVEDGKQGVLNSQQQIPYKNIDGQGNVGTQFANAGISTTVTPQILGARSDSVALNLDFSVKALVGQTDSGPMISNREIKTSVVVRSSLSAAVGGLISNESSTGYNRLPANAPTNPLFSLYASKDFQRNQSQFVVFVTPIIKSSASAGAEKIKRKFRLRD